MKAKDMVSDIGNWQARLKEYSRLLFELGEEAEKEHQKIINQCLKSGVSNVFLVGNIFNRLNKTSYESYATTTALINRLKKQPIKNTFILIKGSRGIQLETLVDSL